MYNRLDKTDDPYDWKKWERRVRELMSGGTSMWMARRAALDQIGDETLEADAIFEDDFPVSLVSVARPPADAAPAWWAEHTQVYNEREADCEVSRWHGCAAAYISAIRATGDIDAAIAVAKAVWTATTPWENPIGAPNKGSEMSRWTSGERNVFHLRREELLFDSGMSFTGAALAAFDEVRRARAGEVG